MFNLLSAVAEATKGFDPTHNPDEGLPDGTYPARIMDVQYKEDQYSAIWKNNVKTSDTEEAESIRISYEVTGDGATAGGRAMSFMKFSESTSQRSVNANIQRILYLANGFGIQFSDESFSDIQTLAATMAASFIGKDVVITVTTRNDFSRVSVKLPDGTDVFGGDDDNEQAPLEKPLDLGQQTQTQPQQGVPAQPEQQPEVVLPTEQPKQQTDSHPMTNDEVAAMFGGQVEDAIPSNTEETNF